MRITLEQVETLRKKIYCDYQTAEKALRKSRGNIDDAILYLKKRENKKIKKVVAVLHEIINKTFSYNLLIFHKDKKVFNFPVILILILVWSFSIPLPIILSIGVLAALSEFSFEIMNRNEYSENERPAEANDFTSESNMKSTEENTEKNTEERDNQDGHNQDQNKKNHQEPKKEKHEQEVKDSKVQVQIKQTQQEQEKEIVDFKTQNNDSEFEREVLTQKIDKDREEDFFEEDDYNEIIIE